MQARAPVRARQAWAAAAPRHRCASDGRVHALHRLERGVSGGGAGGQAVRERLHRSSRSSSMRSYTGASVAPLPGSSRRRCCGYRYGADREGNALRGDLRGERDVQCEQLGHGLTEAQGQGPGAACGRMRGRFGLGTLPSLLPSL